MTMDLDDDFKMWMVIGGIAAFIIFSLACVIADEKEWDEFKKTHNCSIVAHIDGDVFNTFSVGSNGQPSIGVGETSDKTGWKCDDGITYYRDN